MDIKEYITKHVDYLLDNNLVDIRGEENVLRFSLKNNDSLNLNFLFTMSEIFLYINCVSNLCLEPSFCKKIFNKITKYEEEQHKITILDNSEECINLILETKPVWE